MMSTARQSKADSEPDSFKDLLGKYLRLREQLRLAKACDQPFAHLRRLEGDLVAAEREMQLAAPDADLFEDTLPSDEGR